MFCKVVGLEHQAVTNGDDGTICIECDGVDGGSLRSFKIESMAEE